MPKISKITDEQLIEAVKNSISFNAVLRYLNIRPAGGSFAHYKKRILKLGLDTSHFLGKSSNKIRARVKTKDILVLRTEGSRQKTKRLVKALLDSGVKHECSKCGQLPTWLGNPLTLDVDHINENWLDDRLENLRFLCPNCHSQFSRKLLAIS